MNDMMQMSFGFVGHCYPIAIPLFFAVSTFVKIIRVEAFVLAAALAAAAVLSSTESPLS